MHYVLIEIQKYDTGAVAVIPAKVYEDRREAESAYYRVLSEVAMATIPLISVTLVTERGEILMTKCYELGIN